MRIAIDATVLDYNREGIGGYIRQLLANLPPQFNGNELVLMAHPSIHNTDPELVQRFTTITFAKPQGRFTGWKTVWQLRKLGRKHQIDQYLSTHSHLLPLFYASAWLIHDISPVLYPHYYAAQINHLKTFAFKQLFALAMRFSKHIFTISEFSKTEVVRQFRISQSKVSAIMAGPGTWVSEAASATLTNQTLKKFKLNPNQYLLAVGTLSPRKDYITMLRGFAEFVRINPKTKLKLVIAGKQGWVVEPIFQTWQSLTEAYNHLEGKVVFTDYLGDAAVNVLAHNCLALVSTSVYEGFGLPPLEALLLGKEVIITDIPIYRELYKGIAHFVAPKNPESLALEIDEVGKGSRLNDREKSQALAQKYNWQQVAKSFLAYYNHKYGSATN